jgi:hypothetical protein
VPVILAACLHGHCFEGVVSLSGKLDFVFAAACMVQQRLPPCHQSLALQKPSSEKTFGHNSLTFFILTCFWFIVCMRGRNQLRETAQHMDQSELVDFCCCIAAVFCCL